MAIDYPQAARYQCSSCGDCCRNWLVPLTEADKQRIEALDWPEALATDVRPQFPEFYARSSLSSTPTGMVLQQKSDQSCLFLDSDNLCAIHKHFGEDKKPLACRIFPFQVLKRPSKKGPKVTWQVQFACKSVAAGTGPSLKKQKAFFGKTLKELEAQYPIDTVPAELSFDEQRQYSSTALDTVVNMLTKAFQDRSLAFHKRLLIVTRFLDLFSSSKFQNLGDKRWKIIESFMDGTRNQVQEGKIERPLILSSLPERLLFRQILAFRSLDHSPDFLGQGGLGQARARLGQVWHAFLWMLDRGRFRPPFNLPNKGLSSRVVRHQAPAIELDSELVDEPLTRYLCVQLQSRRLFESGLRRRSFLAATGLLLRQIPAILLFARMHALTLGQGAVTKDNVEFAIRWADLSLGQLPVTSGMFARTRQRLLRDMNGPWYHLDWVSLRLP